MKRPVNMPYTPAIVLVAMLWLSIQHAGDFHMK